MSTSEDFSRLQLEFLRTFMFKVIMFSLRFLKVKFLGLTDISQNNL